ncbi:MAG: hypothetical protein PSY14_00140 [bacterium]|nr:hypothetical protein [bacterium]
MTAPLPKKKRKFPWEVFVVLGLIGWLFVGGILKGSNCDFGPAPVTSTIAQVKSYEAALTAFKDQFNRLPGDVEGIIGCDGFVSNPDGKVGNIFFSQELKPCYNQSTSSIALKEDESIRFWQELLKEDLISGVVDARSAELQLSWGETMPAARVGGGFVVGYADGKFPESLSPQNQGMKGTILVLKSSPDDSIALDTPDKHPLSPARAAQIDRKLDDGKPNKGFVQAYGAPSCFTIEDGGVSYAEANIKKDCGLIFRIAD